MSNPYTQYYINQVGGALPGFSGVRYQRGHGFFGRIFSGIGSFIKQLAPSLAKRALPSAISLGQDVLSGENVAQSAKKRLIEAGRNVADETLDNLKSRLQKGKGIPRRRRKQNTFTFPMNKRSARVNKRRTRVNKRKSRSRKKLY